MPNVTSQQLIRYFESTEGRGVIPYSNTEMVTAVRESSLRQERQLLEHLLYAMEGAYCRANPEEPTEMLRNARDTFATLAYLADHGPCPGEWLSLGPVKAYAKGEYYGRAMDYTREIFGERQIDLMNDVFQENGSNTSLN